MSLLYLTQSNFEETISNGVTLVDFWATWCGPCRVLNPIVEKLAKDFKGKARIAKVNVDDCTELTQLYNISSIPTMIIFKNGKVLETIIGVNSEEVITNLINKYL